MDRRCSSCGGFCKKSGCERENVQPKKGWVGLTDEEVEALDCTTVNACDWNEYEVYKPSVQEFARAIEAKLKEKNGG